MIYAYIGDLIYIFIYIIILLSYMYSIIVYPIRISYIFSTYLSYVYLSTHFI